MRLLFQCLSFRLFLPIFQIALDPPVATSPAGGKLLPRRLSAPLTAVPFPFRPLPFSWKLRRPRGADLGYRLGAVVWDGAEGGEVFVQTLTRMAGL
jgi:hypothetical protein